jgi:hypothetical protein
LKIVVKNMEDIKIQGFFEVTLEREGRVIEKREVKNTITKTGLAEIANIAGNVSTPASFTYLALGTGTTASTSDDTALQTEISDSGLQRASATVTRVTTTNANDTLQLSKTFSATGTKAVTECGVFNASSVGIMLGRQVFSALNVINGDTIGITYKIKFS